MPSEEGSNHCKEDHDSVRYLQSLDAIRERCNMVKSAGVEGRLDHFKVDMNKMSTAVNFIEELIKRDYGNLDEKNLLVTLKKIPPHGRWRHFGDENMNVLLSKLEKIHENDAKMITKSVLDLFIVAVLLDAGAGDQWKYNDKESGKIFNRSEGLAVASLRMFTSGKFSSSGELKVDSIGLKALKESDLIEGFQVNETNPLLGVSGRLNLLHRLGVAIEGSLKHFPKDHELLSRPGNLLDYLTIQTTDQLHIDKLWEVVLGLNSIWPEGRTKLNGVSLGDVWPCQALNGKLIPFHKLSQWLTYSLLEPINRIMNIKIVDETKLTGLAEYRNGGLFVDLGILKLRSSDIEVGLLNAREQGQTVPLFQAHDQVIIEWRALTVALIDELAGMLRTKLNINQDELPLAKVLEAGTWKAGREIAKKLRPNSSSPPIAIFSDGTLF